MLVGPPAAVWITQEGRGARKRHLPAAPRVMKIGVLVSMFLQGWERPRGGGAAGTGPALRPLLAPAEPRGVGSVFLLNVEAPRSSGEVTWTLLCVVAAQ